MTRKLLFFLFLAVLLVGLVTPIFALERVKLGSSIRLAAHFFLPPMAGEERGFWKENGLEVEWVPFAGTVPQMNAVAARAINIGLATVTDPPMAAERGLPVIMVMELLPSQAINIWVRADSPYRRVEDLKGARVAATTLGGPMHAFGRIMVAAHKIEKDVRFVGAGGVPQMLAGIRAGAFEAIINTFGTTVGLKLEGIVRDIATLGDYLPKPWTDQVVFARKDFAQSKPDVVRKMLKAMLQSFDFMRENPRWTIDKLKSFQGVSEQAAKLVYDKNKFTITGKIDRKAVENVRKVLIEYGILTDKVPAVDELFTNEYLP